MNANGELVRLVGLVAEFEKLDASIFDTLKSGEKDLVWDVILQTMTAKKEIKRFFSECGPLNVDNTLGLKLKKIRDNYGYTIDLVFEAFALKTGKTLSQELEEDIDYVDALFSEGTASYVDEGFFTRKNEVGTLIVSQSLPENFVYHFQNLRECYALGLFQATVIYCRAVIETGCFEALRRRGQVRLDSKVEDFREYSLKKLMQSIKHYVYPNNWDKADKVIKKADSILHSKRQKVIVTQPEAYDSIKDTLAIVEEIFSSGSHKNQRRR